MVGCKENEALVPGGAVRLHKDHSNEVRQMSVGIAPDPVLGDRWMEKTTSPNSSYLWSFLKP